MAGERSSSFPVEKLKGIQDYHNWKFAMRMVLIHEDLWDCVGELKCEDDRKQMKALAKICLAVHSSAYPHVRNAKTAYEAWSNLKRAYEDRGLCRRLSLLRALFGVKLSEFGSMDTYLSKVTDVVQQLSDIGSPLEDDFVAVIMLSGLPSEYDPLIMSLENGTAKLSSELVKMKLLQEHLRRDDKKDEEVSALAVKSRKPIKCFRCQKPGHIMKNCPLMQKDSKPKEKKEVNLAALSMEVKGTNIWCVDSGATNHLCKDRRLFSDFETIEPFLNVNVANGDILQAVGKGNVKVNVDCQGSDIKSINGVYFVPKLTCNLLSVSALTKKGFTVSFDEKMCRIIDAGKLAATATNINNVYQLNTRDLVCSVASSESTIAPPCAKNVVTFPQVIQSANASTGLNGPCLAEQAASTSEAIPSGSKVSQGTWHRRLAHLNSRSMYVMKQGMVKGLDYDDTKYQSCIACVEGKQTRLPFPKKSLNRSNEVLGLVHTDLCGPMQQVSLGGAKYFLTFTDDYTRKTFVYFLQYKSEVLQKFKTFKALVENQTGKKIKILRSDNGGEYISNNFQTFLKQHGIVHQTTLPYSPAQNGVSERANRTIVEKVRCMLVDSGLDTRFWAEAVLTAVYIKNRTPTKAVMGATPEEKWTGRKVDVSHFRIFGCLAYAMVHIRKKLDPKSKRYIFIGYCEESKGYRLIDPECPTKCTTARNVTFFENQFISNDGAKSMSNDDNVGIILTPSIVTNNNTVSRSDHSNSVSESLNEDQQNDAVLPTETRFSDDISTKSKQRRQEVFSLNDTDDRGAIVISSDDSSGEIFVPGRSTLDTDLDSVSFDSVSENIFACTLSCESDEPMTVKEALSGREATQWREAMQDEYDSFNKNNCWTLTELKTGQKPVKCKWVLKKKRGLNGQLLKHKARLVAKGFTQKYGIDYQETFAPVIRYSTIRMLFAIAAEYDLDIDQLDVKTAFLNGDLHEDVVMEQPEGFVIKGKEHLVYKLNKSIYGLKQAAKCWYDKITGVLTNKMQFKKSSVEPCVYFKNQQGRLTIIALYVDDILLFSHSAENKREVKEQLMSEFEMRDLGTVHEFLGMRVCREKGKITLDQSDYIKSILSRFKMTGCKSVATPMETGLKLTKAETKNDNLEYRNLIGCLMYVAVCTRPDIAHAVSSLSQFNDCYADIHWKAAKRVLRYLKGTINYRLVFEQSGLDISGYVDADWAACEVDRKSYTGFVFKIGNCVVSWESRKQRTVALSSTEAEVRKCHILVQKSESAIYSYMALSDACKEALFMRTLFKECLSTTPIITLYNDNQSAQKLCENSMFHARTKHIDVRHHFIRDIVSKKLFDVKYLPTDEMTADILTKPLVTIKFLKFVTQLNLKV